MKLRLAPSALTKISQRSKTLETIISLYQSSSEKKKDEMKIHIQ